MQLLNLFSKSISFVAVSILFGIVGYIATNLIIGIVLYAIVAIVAQIIIVGVIGLFQANKQNEVNKLIELDNNAILEANTVNVECSACREIHKVPIILSERNTFKCSKCNAKNVIYVTCESALETQIPNSNE